MRECGWDSVKSWVEYMDEEINHVDRKYWNYDPIRNSSGATGFATGIEMMMAPGIANVHRCLADFARRRIWQNWDMVPLIDIEEEQTLAVRPKGLLRFDNR